MGLNSIPSKNYSGIATESPEGGLPPPRPPRSPLRSADLQGTTLRKAREHRLPHLRAPTRQREGATLLGGLLALGFPRISRLLRGFLRILAS